MSLVTVGRIVVKLAGRDSGRKAVIVDVIDEHYVLLDGQTRRRKCNINHLELLDQEIKIKKNASHGDVVSEFKKFGIEIVDTKPKEKKERPKKQRKEKLKARKDAMRAADEKQKKGKKKAKVEGVKEEKSGEGQKEVKASSFEEAVEKESKKEEKK